jgi:hypothetical protein
LSRILIAPQDISGAYRKIHLGLKSLGLDVDFVNFFPDWYDEQTQIFWEVNNAINNVKNYRISDSIFDRSRYKFTYLINVFIFFIRATFRYRTFLFVYGNSLLPRNLDLPLLKLLKKRVILGIGHGSESRPPYIDGNWTVPISIDHKDYSVFKALRALTKKRQKNITRMEKYADVVIGLPTTSHFLSGSYINKVALGQPIYAQPEIIHRKQSSAKVKIIHIPSDPAIKGSKFIRDSIEKLSNE